LDFINVAKPSRTKFPDYLVLHLHATLYSDKLSKR
jgi:hypothetical protein